MLQKGKAIDLGKCVILTNFLLSDPKMHEPTKFEDHRPHLALDINLEIFENEKLHHSKSRPR